MRVLLWAACHDPTARALVAAPIGWEDGKVLNFL